MPIPGGGRYRVVHTSGGAEVRLHFDKSGNVNEAKNLATGKVHTPAEFAADKKRTANKKARDDFKKRVKGGLSG